MRLINQSRHDHEVSAVKVADNYWSRLKGLCWTHPEENPEALWIKPCSSIHTFGMVWPIDAVFLNRESLVIKMVMRINPWRVGPVCWNAYSVIEFFSGQWDSGMINLGDKLSAEQSN